MLQVLLSYRVVEDGGGGSPTMSQITRYTSSYINIMTLYIAHTDIKYTVVYPLSLRHPSNRSIRPEAMVNMIMVVDEYMIWW